MDVRAYSGFIDSTHAHGTIYCIPMLGGHLVNCVLISRFSFLEMAAAQTTRDRALASGSGVYEHGECHQILYNFI